MLLCTYEHGSFEGSLSLLVNGLAFEITLSSSFFSINQSLENIIGLRGVNES